LNPQQRFCPLCDRSFEEGEAVLRCEGCGVLHHPGCWVTNGGCVTQTEHKVAPQAQAYTSGSRSPGVPAPHPGEGLRTTVPPAPPAPIPFRAAPRPPDSPAEPETVGSQHPSPEVTPPSPPRRYVPPPGDPVPRKPLPRIYERHRLLGFWYVPVAGALAIGVAFGVVWLSGQLFGGDSKPAAPAPTVTATAPGSSTSAATPSASPSAAQTATTATTTPAATASTGPGKFSAGETLTVQGTGDCLNVRTDPGVENDAIVCIADGTEVRVTGGPRAAGGLTWWKVETRLGEGWAAEEYLAKKP